MFRLISIGAGGTSMVDGFCACKNLSRSKTKHVVFSTATQEAPLIGFDCINALSPNGSPVKINFER